MMTKMMKKERKEATIKIVKMKTIIQSMKQRNLKKEKNKRLQDLDLVCLAASLVKLKKNQKRKRKIKEVIVKKKMNLMKLRKNYLKMIKNLKRKIKKCNKVNLR